MAIFTRINGDAAGVVNADAGRSFANAAIINTGIAAPLTAYKITFPNGNLAAELTTGGAVENVIRYVEANASVLAYQVDAAGTGTEISVLVERTGWASDTALQNFIVAQTQQYTLNTGGTATYYANVTTSNVWVGGGFAVSSSGGLKLA
jgi:hypothetical protein